MKSWLTIALVPDDFQFLGALADATTKATLLLFVSWLIVILLRRQSAAVRHRVWALSIYGLIAMPFLSWMVPGWRLVVFHAAPPTTAAILPATMPVSSVPGGVATPQYSTPGRLAVEGRAPVPATAVGERAAFALPARPSVRAAGIEPNRGSARDTAAPWAAPGALLAVWGLGAFAVGLPTLLGLIGNQRLRRHAQPVTGEDWLVLLSSIRRKWSIRRNVELLRCEAAPIPLTWGVVRPVILLPADAPSWPEPKRRLVLLHEFAHILRFDAGVQLASRLASACYWFHPMVWYALHRLRLECEHACDDCVVLAGERPTDYASQLVELARSARESRYSVTIAMARTNVLEDRLKALFDDTRSHLPVDRRAGRLIAASIAALVLGLAMLHPVFSAAAPNGQTPPARSNAAATSPAAEPVRKGTGRIAGRVVHGDGGAAAQAAEVVLLPPPPKGEEFYIGKRPLRRTTTGGDGAFSFDGLSPGRYGVWANLGKLSSRHRQAKGLVAIVPESGVAPKPVELRLVPGVRVTVRVKERATGKPIPNATVQPGWSDLIDDFTTDRDGQVHAQPFTPERWLLEVWADGFAKESRWLNLENGADAEAEFLLDPGGDLEGVVRDPAGKPVAGVGLSIFPDGGNQQFAYVETDANGRYALWHLPRNVDMRILELGTGDYFHESVPTRLTGRRHELDLTLRLRPHGGSIVGNVVDHKGRPIAGAELINPSNSSDKVRKAETGPDGRFRLENLYQTMVGKEVIVRAKGFAPTRVKVEPGPADKPAEVSITLEAGHRLKGRVTDQKGLPLEGVRVYFADGNSPHSDGGSTTTDVQGLFAFDSLPMNPPFSFRKEGYSNIANRNLPIDEDDLIKVEMVPAGVIVGTVIDSTTGKPIRAFNVQVTFSPQSQPGEPSAGLRSDLVDPGQVFQSDAGRFQIGDMVIGMPLQVIVSAEGYERRVIERVVVALRNEAVAEAFRLDPLDPSNLRPYRGRLLDAVGKPVVGAQLRLFAARDRNPDRRADFPFNWTMIKTGQLARQPNVARFLESSTDTKGLFQFSGIPKATEVELAWWGKGIAPGRADHLERVAADREGWFDISLPVPARIVGTVDRKTYTAAGRVQISPAGGFVDSTDVELKPDQADFAIDDLAPGEYTVSLQTYFERLPDTSGGLTTRTLATKNVTVGAGETSRVDFAP